MKSLVFNQNDFLTKNNFSNVLKSAVHNMVFDYFKNLYIVPLNFEIFDKEISDLIIKLQEEQEDLRQKRNINNYKIANIPSGSRFIIDSKKLNKRKRIKNPPIHYYKFTKNTPLMFKKSKRFIT